MAEASVCSTCGNLLQFNVVGKWEDLQKTAKTGCDACAMLLRGVQSFKINTDKVIEFRTQIDLTLYLCLTGEENQPEPLNVTLEFYTEEGQLSRWRKIGPGRHVAENRQSDQSVALMKMWLSDCLHTHSACRRDRLSQLPTRLIAVGSSNEELYLHIPRPEERSEYVALSHRWGQHNPLVTNKASLKPHQKHLNFDRSSKLFAEAVELTRKLGFPYIWIDSLCIIQDDDEDWSKEAVNMTTVFNNATLTLLAHASKDSSCSLYPDASLTNRSITLRVAERVEDEQETGNCCETVFVREVYRYPHPLASSYHTARAPKSSFLAPRGWVLQEELLSPRSLHFHAEEMSWTCSSYNRCECRIMPNVPLPSLYRGFPAKADCKGSSPDNLQVELRTQSRTVRSNIRLQSTLSNPTDREGERTADLLADWPDVVMEYSHRLLTKSSDKLPALTGLAGYIQKVSPNERFFGGLWLSDLLFQLLWSRNHLFEGQRLSALTDEAKKERRVFEVQMYANRHLSFATWSWMSLPTHAAILYPTRHKTRSPMKRSYDYSQHLDTSRDHWAHFVEPLFGNDDFVKILDIQVWVQKAAMNSWGPGILTLACRCIYIGVFEDTVSSNESEEMSGKGRTEESRDGRASTTNLSFAIVDHSGQKGGSYPSDADLTSFNFNWDFPGSQGEPPSGMVDTRLAPGHRAVINKWRDYKHQNGEPSQPTNTIQDAVIPSTPSIADQSKGDNIVEASINIVSERPPEHEKQASEPTVVKNNRNRTFALMLAGITTWVHNFTPKRLEGVCLLLEEVDKANNVYRRAGYANGVGSVEAWLRDVPKSVIHIV